MIANLFRNYRPSLLILATCSLSFGVYLIASAWLYQLGFPLDDAWIHQTYARNLAYNREWSFIGGVPSAGSTAPLWSLVLAIGFWFNLGPHIWTYVIGWLSLCSMAIMGAYGFRVLCPTRESVSVWVGLFFALEWHLVWAAGSGMETLLFALLILGVLIYLAKDNTNWMMVGLLIGLGVWIRPDGITLVGPAVVMLIINRRDWKHGFNELGKLTFGLVLIFMPYLLFNRLLAGSWWPNTFFAKQAEYAELRLTPLWLRYWSQTVIVLVGAGALLLPGFILGLVSAIRTRLWAYIVGAIWFLGYLFIYAWRLPVTYQHGRYIIPAIPVFFLLSLLGLITWVQLSSGYLWKRTLSKVWVASLSFVLLLFWGLGARAYALDVAVIESEMVKTAKWISNNTPTGSLIAAHDIGALGYFTQRDLLDLAGLVSPEVIPFIRDELALEEYLNSREADFLVTFPGWYPYLVNRSELLYTTGSVFSPMLDGENLSVYRWLER